MSGLPTPGAPHASETNPPTAEIPAILRIAGIALRTIFIVALLLVTIRVSLPQNETIWTAYDTPADLVRLALGIGVSIWIVIQLFRLPRDVGGYRTWLYLGFAAVPFAVVCALAVWH
jgi:hypothetical protein